MFEPSGCRNLVFLLNINSLNRNLSQEKSCDHDSTHESREEQGSEIHDCGLLSIQIWYALDFGLLAIMIYAGKVLLTATHNHKMHLPASQTRGTSVPHANKHS